MAEVRVSRRTLAWGECDPAGIIFYPNYYRFMDEAAWAMLDDSQTTPVETSLVLLEALLECRGHTGLE